MTQFNHKHTGYIGKSEPDKIPFCTGILKK